MEFIGREHELAVLESHYASGRFEFAAVYGRRRVGKTRLLREFVRGKKAVFFTGTRAAGNVNLQSFQQALAQNLGIRTGTTGFLEQLRALLPLARQERLILVIDEYPYFDENVEGAMSFLQQFIDLEAEDTRLFLILCGSSMHFMKHQLLGRESPLYGRRTFQLEVHPLDYYECQRFLPGRTPEELVAVYGMTGGIPQYLSLFRTGDLMTDAVAAFVADDGLLAVEPEELFLSELKDPAKYTAVTIALAGGRSRTKELADAIGLAPPEVSACLQDLIDLEYVQRVTPIGERSGTRRTQYFLRDNLLRFYYRVILPSRAELAAAPPEQAQTLLSAALPAYLGHVFEDLCGQFLLRRGYTALGRWWGKDRTGEERELDVVALRQRNGRTEGAFGECKFPSEEPTESVLFRLKDTAALVPGFDVKTYWLFSRTPFSPHLQELAQEQGVKLVTLEELYGALAVGTVMLDRPEEE